MEQLMCMKKAAGITCRFKYADLSYLFRLYEFYVRFKFYIIAYNQAASFGKCAPMQAIVFAVQFAGNGKACAYIAPAVVGHDAAMLYIERNGFCGAAHREVTMQLVRIISCFFH